MPHVTGVLVSRAKLLMMHYTSDLGVVCLFYFRFLFFEVLVIVLKKILIASCINSCTCSFEILSCTFAFPKC